MSQRSLSVRNNVPASPASAPKTPIAYRVNPLLNYQIKGQLGEGAFSRVFAARYLPCSDRRSSYYLVALKKIKLEELSDQYYRLCNNEVALLKKINSPNVIRCYESFIYQRDLYVALEYADGKDLGVRIEELRIRGMIFSERAVWYYFAQICKGLEDMHAKRILHRDLKPANVFLTQSGRVKLGDLGLSRHFSAKTAQAMTRVGTEYYMAPERNSSGGYHFKSDIWSLGCLLYEMCTLRSPFNGETVNAFALHKKIEVGDILPFPMSVYSRYIQFFTYACLATNPEDRPSAAQASISAWKMRQHFEQLLADYNKQQPKLSQPPATRKVC